MVLLGKWKWRLISRGQALLRDILIARLRIHSILFHLGGRLGGLRNVSQWWEGVSLLGSGLYLISHWFPYGVVKVVRNGRSTSFWDDH
jgi:hypothetical protein